MIATLIALALQAQTPQMADPRTLRDWYVGCDNTSRCQAVALMPEGMPDDSVTALLERRPIAQAQPLFLLTSLETAPARITIDGRPVAARFISDGPDKDDRGIIVDPADWRAFIRAVRDGQWMELRDAGGAITGRVSLTGAAAAMLAMDEAQGRIGLPSALVNPGTRFALAPGGNRQPSIWLQRAQERAGAIGPADIARLRQQVGCPADEAGPGGVITGALGGQRTLVLLSCGAGAYNFSYVPMIATRASRSWRFEDAPFDVPVEGDATEGGQRQLVNADWDQANVTIADFAKGRGIGDCGTRSRYGWDGRRFRLLEREVMGECRGSMTYVTIWRTDAR